ncbi:hypothetical protein ACFL1X_00210 [Candidatus Hydrogenedentota bacterium]
MLGYSLCFLSAYIALDLALRVLNPLELHGGWEHQQVNEKLTKLKEYVSVDKDIDVVLYGNSVVMNVDVETIESDWSKMDLKVFNAGTGGLRPESANFVFNHGILPLSSPSVVLFVVGPRDLKDKKFVIKERQPPMTSYMGRRILARTRSDRIMSNLETAFYSFRIRRPARHFITHGGPPKTTTISVDARGVQNSFNGDLSKKYGRNKPFPDDEPYRSRYDNYMVNPDGECAELKKLLESIQESGAKAALLNACLAPSAFSLFDDSKGNYSLYMETVTQIASECSVPFYDMHRDLNLGNNHFANADHTNGVGDEVIANYISRIVLPDLLKLE